MPQGKTSARMLLAREREVQAVALRKAGYSHERIGEELGVSKTAVTKMLLRCLQRSIDMTTAEAEVLLQLELDRIDQLLTIAAAMIEHVTDMAD